MGIINGKIKSPIFNLKIVKVLARNLRDHISQNQTVAPAVNLTLPSAGNPTVPLSGLGSSSIST